jgi:imidazole glycerol-phosphate synthase subunit HisH
MDQQQVVVIDYGLGNLLSVGRAVEFCGGAVNITSNPKEILSAKRVILPGVGAFNKGMSALESRGLINIIKEIADKNTPLLGICLGMQLFMDEGCENGVKSGIGLIRGKVIPIPKSNEGIKQKIPHIGWSELHSKNNQLDWKNTLLEDVEEGQSVYFVHSFMTQLHNPDHQIASCFYGDQKIPAVIAKNNITGCQFHPEKSGEVGLNIFRKFLTC